MKCRICKRPFREGDDVVPVMRYVVSERRGDWVTSASAYIHLRHLAPRVTPCLQQVGEDDWCSRPEGHAGRCDADAKPSMASGGERRGG
jgi:hypothetical protein